MIYFDYNILVAHRASDNKKVYLIFDKDGNDVQTPGFLYSEFDAKKFIKETLLKKE